MTQIITVKPKKKKPVILPVITTWMPVQKEDTETISQKVVCRDCGKAILKEDSISVGVGGRPLGYSLCQDCVWKKARRGITKICELIGEKDE